MKKTIIVCCFMLLTGSIYAQDLIILTTGDEIKAKVLDIDVTTIKYKKFEYLNGPNYIIEKKKVFMIKYENGTKDIITEIAEKDEQIKQSVTNPQDTPVKQSNEVALPKSNVAEQNDLCKLGKTDADENYKSSGATLGTFAATIIATPIIGLIPAIACSSTAPSDVNLRMPAAHSDNALYKNCYKEKAWKSKKSSTWIGWMAGTAIWLTVTGLLIQ